VLRVGGAGPGSGAMLGRTQRLPPGRKE
jgi:hypothetical protein